MKSISLANKVKSRESISMHNLETDGRLQVTSAISLLEFSRLVKWDQNSAQFTPEDRGTFESSWRNNVSPVFGRLICWINFSAGAEFLAKGVCLLNGIDVRRVCSIPANPTSNLTEWVNEYFKNPNGNEKTTNFGDLGAFVSLKDKNNNGKFLKKLCETRRANPQDEKFLLVAYDFLRQTIRNRDAHAYIPNVRNANFDLVPKLFVNSFNLLLTWIPDGQSKLNIWRDKAEEFIDSLPPP